MSALTLTRRRRLAMARAGSIALDALLIAYAMWCCQFIGVHLGITDAFLSRFPLLLALAPLGACLWQASGMSMGQRGYRIAMRPAGAEQENGKEQGSGAEADLDRRALYALVSGLELLAVAAPAALWPTGGAALAGIVALGLGAVALSHPHGRGLAERIAGITVMATQQRRPVLVRAWYRRPNVWVVLVLLGLTSYVGAVITELDFGALATGAQRTGSLWAELLSPDWSITRAVIERMIETVYLALMASVLALPPAFLMSFLGARNLMEGTALGRLTYVLTRIAMNVLRSIEPLVWAIIFVLWVGVGPFAGMLALLVHSAASLGKLYSEAVEAIDPGPVEAIRATGGRPLQVVRYAVVPQVIPPFLSFTVYRWDINVRMATILGLVGGGGIGDLLINYQQLGAWSKVGTIIVFITLVVWVMDFASSKARERLV